MRDAIAAASAAYLNKAVERTGHTTGFFHVQVSVGCGPPLTASVRCQRSTTSLSQKLNHHFVPQYHFRLFTGGKRYIHLASRDGARFVSCASIKGQCARHKFYGNERVENWLSNLESRHAAVYRAVIDIAWNARTTPLSHEENHQLREAILLQRCRTPRNARIYASSIDQM